jgi:uncharacterized membrane protein SirB2
MMVGMDYTTLKLVHQIAVALSLGGFVLRGGAGLLGQAWVRGRAARTWPHAVDTVLLASAIALAWTAGLAPWHTPWLMSKIAGLLAYIGLGAMALRPGLGLRRRAAAWVGALFTFGFIVSVAITKHPAGFLLRLAAGSPLN